MRQRGLGRNVGRTWREPDGFASIGGTERNAAEPSRSGGAGNPAELGRNLAETWRKIRKLKRGVVGSINQYDFWHGFHSQPPSLRLTCLPSGSARLLPGFCRRVSATRFPPGPAIGSTRFLPVAGCCRVAPGFRQRGSSSRLPLQCAFFCRVSSQLPPPYMPPRFR